MLNIAIIGAGLSGLTLASQLKGYANVTVFEKSRGLGGRMSTRYADPFQYDHGAQYFTARTKIFSSFLKPYIDSGTVQPWEPKVMTLEKGGRPYKRDWFEVHYVAVPKMTELCRKIAEDLDVKLETEISSIVRDGSQWLLNEKSEKICGPFDWVITAIPAAQAGKLLPSSFSGYSKIEDVKMLACFSVMLGFEKALKLNWDAAAVKDSLIGWISVNSSKPERKTGYSLLIQTTSEWAEAHLQDDKDIVLKILIEELASLLSDDIKNFSHSAIHSWRYADTAVSLHESYLIDHDAKLAACGDWCLEGKVESAFISGYELSKVIKI